MLRAILWDNDGVLVDSERIFYEANRDYFARHEIHISKENFFDWFLARDLGAFPLLAARGMNPDQIAQCRVDRNNLYMERLLSADSLIIPGIQALLNELHSRVRMAVVTSSNRDHFEAIHRNTDLLKYFDFALTAETYAKAKPAPDPYLKAIEKLRLAPNECLAVEDSPRGLESANAAGINCIMVQSPLTQQCSFPGAFRVVGSITELACEINTHL